ncbi:hypothetical protein SNE40_022502 [Patella caerulea]|uniref:Peptidase S1 domain-containing protein n=1 Tax=Patella caerulea TaxID=87958 RepID=A0AAN8IXQ1_PATCE
MNPMMKIVLALLLVAAIAEAQNQRIVGGQDAEPHSHPWQVSLRRRDGNSWSHICGAVMINSNWALTAAHCIDAAASDMQVVAGGHFLQSSSQFERASQLVNKIQHPSYDPNSTGFPNDIGLVELETPIGENGGIKYATLPSDDSNDYSSTSECYITGWGRTTDGGPLPNALQVTPTTVITNSACQSAHGLTGFLGVRQTNICVDGSGTSSACNGDSGGPAVCNVNGEMVVVGVTSWGRSGCPVGYPSVYTRNSKYLNWIRSYTG